MISAHTGCATGLQARFRRFAQAGPDTDLFLRVAVGHERLLDDPNCIAPCTPRRINKKGTIPKLTLAQPGVSSFLFVCVLLSLMTVREDPSSLRFPLALTCSLFFRTMDSATVVTPL